MCVLKMHWWKLKYSFNFFIQVKLKKKEKKSRIVDYIVCGKLCLYI